MYGEVHDASDQVIGAGPPRYCPRCRLDAEPGAALCDGCGERLEDQSYCPVCESYWRLPAKSPCPKHEVPLEEGPPEPEFPHPGKGGARWVTVGTFADALKAEAPRIRLEAEGIPTFLEGARMGSPAMYHVATGGVKLQVPQPLAADARVLLSQTWAPEALGDDLDDAWEELGPEPGAAAGAAMLTVMEAAAFVIAASLLLLLLIAWLARR
jgi:hypothetical protein